MFRPVCPDCVHPFVPNVSSPVQSFNDDGSQQRSQSNPRGGRAGDDSSSVGSAAVSKERLDEMFKEFLARQRAAQMKRERKVTTRCFGSVARLMTRPEFALQCCLCSCS